MNYTTLIDVETLLDHLPDENLVIVDCRFSLAEPELGQQQYLEGHIPGAVYAHLDNDLSSSPVTDNGRHPLPSPASLAMTFAQLGIDEGKQVVAYDAHNGVYASRLWWMLNYMGHAKVAVLDGGWQAWIELGQEVQGGENRHDPVLFTGSPNHDMLITVDDVLNQPMLIDSRGPARYRGEEEPLDPVAGHIPGAVNLFYQEHWENGRYKSTEDMKKALQTVFGDVPANDVTFYCGSGVSACVNLLAYKHVGFGNGRLYVGSWSEWCSDPNRPQETG